MVEAEEGRSLHVATIYGYDSGQPGAAEQNAALFHEVFEAMAGSGQAPWVVGGDWNEEAAAIWSLVAADGRGALFAAGGGRRRGGHLRRRWPAR